MSEEIGRRDLIKLTAGATIVGRALAAGRPGFLTAEERHLVEELTEMIIPADAKSGGAKAAGVAAYIDAKLAEAFEQSERDGWRKGLRLVNMISEQMHGAAFLKCTEAQRLAVLTRMAANEQKPTAPEELFFRDLKSATVQGYYTSRVGIHDDMDYKGNTLQQGEYAGYLPGQPGAK